MRILTRRDVLSLVGVADLIPVIREAMIAVSARDVEMPLRQSVGLPQGNRFGVMPGFLGSPSGYGAKLLSLFPGNPALGRSSHAGLMLLFDTTTGDPMLCMDASELTALRTAAASAVATEVLARVDASVVAIIGAGEQAHAHVAAMRAVRGGAGLLVVWARDARKAAGFADMHGATVAASLEAAVGAADIVCTTTASAEAFLRADMLPPGIHLNAVGASVPSARELTPDCVAELLVFTDYRPSLEAQAGEVIDARAQGLIDADHRITEIGDVLRGAAPGRTGAAQRTLYRSLGVVAQDLAAAHFIMQLAEERHVGVVAEMT